MNETSASQSIHFSAPPPHRFFNLNKHFRLSLGVLLGILLILVFVDRAQIKQSLDSISALTHVSGSYVIRGSAISRSVFRIGWFGNHPVTTKSGTVIDYARSGSNQYALVLSPDGRDEYLMHLGSKAEKLVSTGGTKSALVVSANGAQLAYAQLSPSGFTKTGPSSGMKDWSVSVYSPKTKSAIVLPSAYQPEFFSIKGKQYMEFMSPRGMGIMDLSIANTYNTSYSTSTMPATNVLHPTFVTPDGAHALIYSSAAGAYALYTISGNFPFSFKQVTTLSSAYGQVVGVDAKGFYVVSANTKARSSDVSYVSFAHPTASLWTYRSDGPAVLKLIP